MATTKNIQSVGRAFSILELYQQNGGNEMSLKEIAAAVSLNKNTAFGLVNTLNNLGYLQQNESNQKYVLGLKLLSLSNSIKVQNIIARTVRPYLEEISQKYNETTHCAMEDNGSVIYIEKVEAPRSIYINTQIGTKNYMHCTGVGKCILAYLPADKQERVLSGRLKTMTFNTITNSEQLREELRKTRERGYAMDNEEIEIGLSCVAVPVFSAPGSVACTISVSSMAQRIQSAIRSGVIDDLKRTAAAISREIFNFEPPAEEQK